MSTSRSLVGSSSSSTLPPAAQHLGQVDPVALAAGQHADLLLLVGALEVERGDVGPAVDLPAADLEQVVAAGDLLVDGLVGVEARRGSGRRRRARPVGPTRERRRRRAASCAGEHAEQRRLAGAVGADDADDAGRRQRERQVLDEEPVAVALATGASASMTRSPRRGPGRDVDLELVGGRARRPRPRPAASRRRRRRALPLAWRALGAMRTHSSSRSRVRCRAESAFSSLRQPRLLLLEPARVVALERACPGRGRARGSSRRRCRGSSGRG